MRLTLLAFALLAVAGCASPATPAGNADPMDVQPDEARQGRAGNAAEAPDPSSDLPQAPEPRTWYLDYAAGDQACLQQEGRLLDESPQSRACGHLPGVVMDAPRTFIGQADGDWPAGSAAEGVLVLYGQAPSPSSITVTLRAAGRDLGAIELDVGLLLPVGQVEVPFALATLEPVVAGDALEIEVAYRLPTATDYIVMGESRVSLPALP